MAALVIGQAVLLCVSMPMYVKSPYFCPSNFIPRFDGNHFLLLSKYSLMTLTSAILAPTIQIVLSKYLSSEFSWREVGYWQAVSKISDAYLLFFTSLISVYYLPKLAAIKSGKLLIHELRHAYSYLIPVAAIAAGVVYIFREWITLALYSPQFLPAEIFFAPQLMGDVVRAASLLLAYLMLAKAMTKLFIFSEVLFSITLVLLVYIFTQKFGLIGVSYGYFLNAVCYLIFNLIVSARYVSALKSAPGGA